MTVNLAEQEAVTVLFGGTFNPPHLGHWDLAETARRWVENRIGRPVDLVWVVANRPYHKHGYQFSLERFSRDQFSLGVESREQLVQTMLEQQNGTRAQGGQHRVLTNQALATGWQQIGHDHTDWWDRASYTVDVVDAGQAAGQVSGQPWLLVGADSAKTFTNWQQWQELADRCRILVGPRNEKGPVPAPAGVGPGRWQQMSGPVKDESSTRIRQLVEANAWGEVRVACGPAVTQRLQHLLNRPQHVADLPEQRQVA